MFTNEKVAILNKKFRSALKSYDEIQTLLESNDIEINRTVTHELWGLIICTEYKIHSANGWARAYRNSFPKYADLLPSTYNILYNTTPNPDTVRYFKDYLAEIMYKKIEQRFSLMSQKTIQGK